MMSLKKIDGDLPPNSKVTGMMRSAVFLLIILPTAVEPVNATFLMRSLEVSAAPASSPRPLTMFKTPSGMTSASFSIKYKIDAGVCSAGLSTMQLRSEEHTSELQSRFDLVCRLLLEKKKKKRENEEI